MSSDKAPAPTAAPAERDAREVFETDHLGPLNSERFADDERYTDPRVEREWFYFKAFWPIIRAATPPARLHAPLSDEHPYTYASTQATKCAGCGEYKHTPLRIDAMGGYVCLTCIDKKLGVVLGEFGYPAPQEPLSDEQIKSHWDALFLADNEFFTEDAWYARGFRFAELYYRVGRFADGITAAPSAQATTNTEG